jgi:dihydroorotate dehydrogenase electron transfer subunit
LKQGLVRVAENRPLWSNVQLLSLDAPELAVAMHPGQLALVRDPATIDPYLRRKAWLYQVNGERVTFTLSTCDPLVSLWRTGDTLDLLGPVGRTLEFAANARHVLLIGEGTRVAPLFPIAQQAIQENRAVVLFSRTDSKGDVFPAHLLPPEIEYHTGGDLPGAELVTWADAIVASGSEQLYSELKDIIRAARYRLERGLARVLFDEPTPCGTGACYACAVKTARGVRLACVDGPAFDLMDWGW